jgi:ABC-2 type transport system permease protein
VSVARQPLGFFQHLWLLWGLRLTIGLNRGKKPRRLLAALAVVASAAPGPMLALAFYRLLTLPAVASSPVWPEFLLTLLCFVTTCVWFAWPVMSAGVDDHSELTRYSAFPISSFRLMLASTLATLLEPRSIVFYAPVVGAAAGYMRTHPPSSLLLSGLLFLAFALFNAALSRVGLHLVLNVLRQKRSGQMIGGFFLVVIIA